MDQLTFTTNQISGVKPERVTIGGREFLRVPTVSVVEMVLNGRYLPADEILASLSNWDGVPIPLDHPQVNGEFVSAAHPDAQGSIVGYWGDTRADGSKLKGNMYIDLAKAVDGDAAELVRRFEAGEMVEVSTAYFANEVEQAGHYASKPYTAISRNLKPDHVALLLHKPGACSIKDGCGALRLNAEDDAPAELSSEPAPPVNSTEEPAMDPKDKEKVEGEDVKDDAQTNDGQPVANAKTEPKQDKKTATQQPATITVNAEDWGRMNERLGALDAFLSDHGGFDGVAKTLAAAKDDHRVIVANAQREKDDLVAVLVANQSELTKDDLEAMPVAALHKLARLVGRSAPAQADYSGCGLTYNQQDNDGWEDYNAPVAAGASKEE